MSLTLKPCRNLDNITSLSSILKPSSEEYAPASKVIVTLGPATRPPAVMKEMLRSGIAAARFDLTWGSLEYHLQSLSVLQAAAKETQRLCATCLALKGRICSIVQDYTLQEDGFPKYSCAIVIHEGQEVVITADPAAKFFVPEDARQTCVLTVSSHDFLEVVKPGDTVNVERYLVTALEELCVSLKIVSMDKHSVRCVSCGTLNINGSSVVRPLPKGLPSVGPTPAPRINDADRAAIAAFLARDALDFVALMDVESAADVEIVRDHLDAIGAHSTKILATLQSALALLNFGDIAAAADGIVLARGALGLHVLPEKMAVTQKRVVQLCNLIGKPCAVTDILDSMQVHTRPTRAEATDVANSVIDGADCFLLGPETVRGLHPVLCVKTVIGICREAERLFDTKAHYDKLMEVFNEPTVEHASSSWLQNKLGEASWMPEAGTEGGADSAGDGGPESDPRWGKLVKRSPLSHSTNALHSPLGYSSNSAHDGAPYVAARHFVAAASGSDQDGDEQHENRPSLIQHSSGPHTVSFAAALANMQSASNGPSISGGATHSQKPPRRPPGRIVSIPDLDAVEERNGAANDGEAAEGPARPPAAFARRFKRSTSWGSLATEHSSPTGSPAASNANLPMMLRTSVRAAIASRSPSLTLTSVEVAASSAVLMADHIKAPLILVITDSGRTCSLVAKYRPAVPILSLVVPLVMKQGMSWKIKGTDVARQCGLLRGVIPMLSAPGAQMDMLPSALQRAIDAGLVTRDDAIVSVIRTNSVHTGRSLTVQVMKVGETIGLGAVLGSVDV